MNITLPKILCHRSRGWNPLDCRLTFGELPVYILIICVVAISLVVFFAYVSPSLSGNTDLHIGADSEHYLWYAGVLKGAPSAELNYSYNTIPEIISSLGNMSGPVIVARVFRSNFLILCFNYVLFFVSLRLFAQSESLNAPLLALLLLINPAILVAVLTVSKEILVLVSVAMACKYSAGSKKSRGLLFGTLVFAWLARWQQFLITMCFLFLATHGNGFRRRRRKTIICFLVIAITLISACFSSFIYFLVGVESSDLLQSPVLDALANAQNHFLYFGVVLPKIALNLYGAALLYARATKGLPREDIYNTVIAPLSSLANIVVSVWFIIKRRFSLDNNRIYFAVIYSLLFGVLPYVHNRYFLPVYIILCVEIARHAEMRRDLSPENRTAIWHLFARRGYG